MTKLHVRSLAAIASVLTLCATALTTLPPAQADGPKSAEEIIATERQALENTGLLDELDAPMQATVLPAQDFAASQVPVGFVRLDNHKVVMAAKDGAGNIQPYTEKGVEVGFWDLRSCGGVYATRPDKLFSCGSNPESPFYQGGDYRKARQEAFRQAHDEYGFNTVMVTMQWAEWDKTTKAGQPKLDFTLMDQIVEDAAGAGLKVQWVLFFHIQRNMPDYAAGGLYNIADKDGQQYGIQWAPGYTKVSDYTRNANEAVPELYPEYWQPAIHAQLTYGLSALAEHFRNSPHVMGYQIGNEEGPTGPLNNREDANPYFAAMKQLWMERHPGAQDRDFHQHLGLAVWQSMVQAMREKDPYKYMTTNFQSSDVDYQPEGLTAGWQNMDFYREAGLDGVAPMYYQDNPTIARNVDRYYGAQISGPSDVAYGLPQFIPSEIGISWERGAPTLADMYDTLARGGGGFGLYSLGEMQALTHSMKSLVNNNLAMFSWAERELWSGVPVSQRTTSNLFLSTSDADMTVGTLQSEDPNTVVGMVWHELPSQTGQSRQVPVTISARQAGTYTVSAMVDGVAAPSQTFTLEAGGSATYTGITMSMDSGAVIRVTQE